MHWVTLVQLVPLVPLVPLVLLVQFGTMLQLGTKSVTVSVTFLHISATGKTGGDGVVALVAFETLGTLTGMGVA